MLSDYERNALEQLPSLWAALGIMDQPTKNLETTVARIEAMGSHHLNLLEKFPQTPGLWNPTDFNAFYKVLIFNTMMKAATSDREKAEAIEYFRGSQSEKYCTEVLELLRSQLAQLEKKRKSREVTLKAEHEALAQQVARHLAGGIQEMTDLRDEKTRLGRISMEFHTFEMLIAAWKKADTIQLVSPAVDTPPQPTPATLLENTQNNNITTTTPEGSPAGPPPSVGEKRKASESLSHPAKHTASKV